MVERDSHKISASMNTQKKDDWLPSFPIRHLHITRDGSIIDDEYYKLLVSNKETYS